MKQQKFIFLLVSTFLPILSVHAQKWNWLSIYEKSLSEHAPIQIVELERQQALVQQQQVKGAYIPTLEWNGKAAYSQGKSTINIDEMKVHPFGQTISLPDINTGLTTNGWLGSSSLEASFLIYSGNKVTHLSNAAQSSAEAQEALANQKSQLLLLEVLTLMDQYALLIQSDSLILAAQKVLNENQKVAEKAFEYGIITAYERDQVNLASSDLQVKKVEIQGKKDLLLSKLSQLTSEEINESNVQWPHLNLIQLTHNELSNNVRPEIQALESKIQAEEALIKLHKSWWIPQLQAKASLNYLGVHYMNLKGHNPLPFQEDPLDFRLKNAYLFPMWQVGVGFKWTLFDGLQGSKSAKIATLEQQKTQLQKEEAKELIALEQKQYALQFQSVLEQFNAYKIQANYRLEALKIVEKEFKLGLSKSTDLVDATYKYQTSKMSEYQSLFDLRQTVFQQLRAKGILEKSIIEPLIK